MTAAHCLHPKMEDKRVLIRVGLGSDNVNKGKKNRVKDFKIPKEYKPKPGVFYDIAVLTVSFIEYFPFHKQNISYLILVLVTKFGQTVK